MYDIGVTKNKCKCSFYFYTHHTHGILVFLHNYFSMINYINNNYKIL